MIKAILYLTMICFLTACSSGPHTFDTSKPLEGLPIGKKKKKKKIFPTYAFSSAIKRYTKEKGHFPFDLASFEYHSDYTRTGMQSMRDAGFHYLYISYQYLDSMVIDFAHYPVYAPKINNEHTISIDLTGQITFTKKDSSIVEYRRFDRKVKGGQIRHQYQRDTAGNYRRQRYGY